MDGIANSLTSVIPILPDNGTITNKNGVNGPPVEIAPLPKNSFLSDDMTTELLNNPYTLNLDSDGQNDQLPSGPTPGGSDVPDQRLPDGKTGGAYTLSLGESEEPDISADAALELSRVKSYEELGKNFARRVLRPSREAGLPATSGVVVREEKPAPVPGAPLQPQTDTLFIGTAPRRATVYISPGDIGAATPDEVMPPSDADMSPAAAGLPTADEDLPAYGGASQPVWGSEERVPDMAARLSERLTSTDLETLMSLEPDLRDAFLRMLNNEKTSAQPGPAEGYTDVTSPGVPTVIQKATGPETVIVPADLLPAEIADVRGRAVVPNSPAPEQHQIIPQTGLNQLIVTVSGGGLPDLTAGIVTASAAEALSPRGKLENFQKINELPYSLYLFGPVPGQPREEDEEEDIADPAAGTRKSSGSKTAYLKLSEAIRMASVLHQLYRGGSGRFEEEKPWYLPYVRYAVKTGIINNGEFEDYDQYATRAEAAYILSGSVPDAEFPVINYVMDIPDVDEHTGYGDRIYLLLRAGVLTGTAGSFYPESFITRAEAAVLVGRIATPSDRKQF